MKNKELAVAYGAILLYALITGFSFMVVKSGVGLSTSLQTVTYRFTAALLVGLVLMLLRAVRVSWKGGNKKRLLFTALTYVGFLGFQAWGLMYTTSIVSGILFAAVPILAKVVAGIVLKEKTTWLQNCFACLSVGAVMAMFALGAVDQLSAVSPLGFGLLLVSSISCAVSNVYMRYVKQDYSPVSISFCSAAVGTVVFWGIALARYLPSGQMGEFFAPLANPAFVLTSLYLGTFSTLITGALISFALRTLPAMSATIFGNLSTAISVVAGAVLLHEPLQGYQVVCTVLIITGVLGISVFTGRQASRPAGKKEN